MNSVVLTEGIVQSFNGKKGKNFGFIIFTVNEERRKKIFFHFNDGQFCKKDDNGKITFLGSVTIVDGKQQRLKFPKPGDKIVFCLYTNAKQESKACPWAYVE